MEYVALFYKNAKQTQDLFPSLLLRRYISPLEVITGPKTQNTPKNP